MVTLHADDNGEPLCGETVADSTGLLETAVDMTDVDCPTCLDAAQVHVCGISDPYQWCDGCRVMLSDAGMHACW